MQRKETDARARRALRAGPGHILTALAAGALLAACATPMGRAARVAYTYPVTVPAVHAAPAARGAVAFRAGPRIDLYLPYFHGDANRRPQHIVLRPDDGAGTHWHGGLARLPADGDVVARVARAPAVVQDAATGHEVATLPPGALSVVFPEGPKYAALAGQTLWLVPAGTPAPARPSLARAAPPLP